MLPVKYQAWSTVLIFKSRLQSNAGSLKSAAIVVVFKGRYRDSNSEASLQTSIKANKIYIGNYLSYRLTVQLSI